MLTTFDRVTNEAPGLPDAVLSGLAAMVGAGLLGVGCAGALLLARPRVTAAAAHNATYSQP